MHEMGVVLDIVRTAEQVARTNHALQVGSLVLQVGELTGIVPRYVHACWPAAIEGTLLSGAQLVIEEIPGNGICKQCGKVYNLLEYDTQCPACGSREWDVLSGRDVMIKEIGVL